MRRTTEFVIMTAIAVVVALSALKAWWLVSLYLGTVPGGAW
jgi:hypothetical protein